MWLNTHISSRSMLAVEVLQTCEEASLNSLAHADNEVTGYPSAVQICLALQLDIVLLYVASPSVYGWRTTYLV